MSGSAYLGFSADICEIGVQRDPEPYLEVPTFPRFLGGYTDIAPVIVWWSARSCADPHE
jgi:hypothetical protein